MKLEQDKYNPISIDLLGALERYLNNGIMPGGFLTAVLENNLVESLGRADEENSKNLKDIVRYMYNYFPSNAWGSREKIELYLKSMEK